MSKGPSRDPRRVLPDRCRRPVHLPRSLAQPAFGVVCGVPSERPGNERPFDYHGAFRKKWDGRRVNGPAPGQPLCGGVDVSEGTTPADEGKSPGQIVQVYTWRSALVKSLDCSTCKLVGLVLSLHMNEIGGSAFPSNRLLSEETSLGISTIREHLNDHLHALGWLRLVERGGTRSGTVRANAWQAVMPFDPRQLLADPRQQDGDPRQQTAPPPPAAGPQVVHGTTHEQTADLGLVCSVCGVAGFHGVYALADHQESKDCERAEGFIPAADLKVVGE